MFPGAGTSLGIQVSKNGLFEPFIYKNDHFAKTGSGQTQGKQHSKKERRFSHRLADHVEYEIAHDGGAASEAVIPVNTCSGEY